MQAFWKDAHDEGGLAWDDTNNNRAFLSGTIAATLNGASIYIETLRKPDQYKTEKDTPMKDDILHSPLPKGPAGQFGFHLFQSHMLMSYSKNQKAAKEFLKWIHTPSRTTRSGSSRRRATRRRRTAQVGEAQDVGRGSGDGAVQDRRPRSACAPGYAGPPNRKAAEVLTKYIITDMYAKAAQGMPPQEAVKWAAGEVKKIY